MSWTARNPISGRNSPNAIRPARPASLSAWAKSGWWWRAARVSPLPACGERSVLAAGEDRVRGPLHLQSVGDCLQHPVDILDHVVVPEAQDSIAMIAKPLVATRRVGLHVWAADQISMIRRGSRQTGSTMCGPMGSWRTNFIPQSIARERGSTVVAPQWLPCGEGVAVRWSSRELLSGIEALAQFVPRRQSRPITRSDSWSPLADALSAPTSPRTRGEVKRRRPRWARIITPSPRPGGRAGLAAGRSG